MSTEKVVKYVGLHEPDGNSQLSNSFDQVSTIFILTILLYEDIKELFGEHKYIFNGGVHNLEFKFPTFQHDPACGDNSLLNKLFSKPGL